MGQSNVGQQLQPQGGYFANRPRMSQPYYGGQSGGYGQYQAGNAGMGQAGQQIPGMATNFAFNQAPQMSTPYQSNPAMTGGSASSIPQEVGSATNPNLPVLPPYNSQPHWGNGLQQAYQNAASQYQAQLGGGMKPGFQSAPNQPAAPSSGYVNPFMGMGQANVNTGAVLDSRLGQGNAGLWDYALGKR